VHTGKDSASCIVGNVVSRATGCQCHGPQGASVTDHRVPVSRTACAAVARDVTKHKYKRCYCYVQLITNTYCCCKTACIAVAITIKKLLGLTMVV
jgi:hypothetical protein